MSVIDFIQKELLSTTTSKKARKQIIEVCFKAKEKYKESEISNEKSDNSFDTKINKVINHLREYGSITSWEAINNYKATRLSAIVFLLKERGYTFNSVREKNGKSNWVRYYLVNQ